MTSSPRSVVAPVDRVKRMVPALVTIGLVVAVLCVVAPLAAVVASAVVIVCLAPVGRTLAGRVGTVLLIWMAASQFAYLVAWPTYLPPRQAVVWTMAAIGVLAWRVVKGPTSGLGQILVRRGPSAVPLVAVAATVAWWFWPWRGDTVHVLDRLLHSWDTATHFGIVEQLRLPQTAAANSFPGYPRGYHALVASLMELGWGRAGSFDSELVPYAYAALAVVAGSVVMVSAWVLDAPVFWRRPILLLPATTALVTIFLQLEDASQVPYMGFGNFLEAVGFAATGILVAVSWRRREDTWRWFLLGCAAAGIVGAWPLLLVFLIPVPISVWLARRPFERAALRKLASRVGAAVVPVALAVFVQPAATHGVAAVAGPDAGVLAGLDRFLLMPGAVGTSAVGLPILLPFAGVAIPLGLTLHGRRSPSLLRVAWLWLPAAAAVATASGMLVYEAVRSGAPAYYGVKALGAATLVAGSVAVVAGAYAVDGLIKRRAPSTLVKVAVVVAALVLLLFAGGPVQLGPLPASPGGALRAYTSSDAPERRQALANDIRASCEAVAGKPGEYYLLTAGGTHEDLVRANGWLITCSLDWGNPDHATVLRELLPDTFEKGGMIVDLAVDTRRILRARPGSRVVISAADAPLALTGLSSEEKDRVVTY